MTDPTTPAAPPKGFAALSMLEQHQLRALYDAARGVLGHTARLDLKIRKALDGAPSLSLRLQWIDPASSTASQSATKVIAEPDLEAVMGEQPVDSQSVIEALCTIVRDWAAESLKAHRGPL